MPRDSIATLPNLVSMSRLVMAALFPFVPGTTARLALIAAAGATDFLDGYLARTRGSTTRFGAQIDPFADRCFVLVAVCVLWAEDVFTLSQMLIVAVRDIVVLAVWIGARAVGALRDFTFGPRIAGKVLTVLQLGGLAVACLAPEWLVPVVAVVGVASLVALADYGWTLWRGAAPTATLLLVAAGAPSAAPAQAFRFAPIAQPEIRAAVAVGGQATASVAAAVNVPAGYYVRIGNAVSFGRELGAHPRTAWRAEVTARFLTDPFAESRWGPYAGGGAAVAWTQGRAGRPVLLLIAGADLPSRARWRPAVEFGIGDGARVSLVFKRARTSGR